MQEYMLQTKDRLVNVCLHKGEWLVGVHSKKTGKTLASYRLKDYPKFKTFTALVNHAKANQVTTEVVPVCPAPAPAPAKSAEQERDIFFIDTETTGLSDNDEVIEVSVVDINENIVFHSLVKPTSRIRPSATRVHGITDQMVRKSPTFIEIFPKLKTILKGKKCVFYNAEFDMRKMATSYQKSFDKNNPTLTKDKLGFYCFGYVGLFNDAHPFCLMRFYQHYKGYKKWSRLFDACSEMYVPISDLRGHRATDDAKMTARLYRALQAKGAL